MVAEVKSFQVKLKLFKLHVTNKIISHFPCCESVSNDNNAQVLPVDRFIKALDIIAEKFERRFHEYLSYATEIRMFQNPFQVDVNIPEKFQMEIIDL